MEFEEKVYIPSDEEILAVDRFERLHIRMKLTHSLAEKRDSATWSFTPMRLEGESVPGIFNYTSGWARAAFERADRSIKASIRDSGLDDNEWRNDYLALLEGRLPPPPDLRETGICSNGHQTIKRENLYWVCPSCKEITWTKEL